MTLSQRGFWAWISPVLHTTEEQIYKLCGMDAVVFLRLHRFGSVFFGILCILAVFIMIPSNYCMQCAVCLWLLLPRPCE